MECEYDLPITQETITFLTNKIDEKENIILDCIINIEQIINNNNLTKELIIEKDKLLLA